MRFDILVEQTVVCHYTTEAPNALAAKQKYEDDDGVYLKSEEPIDTGQATIEWRTNGITQQLTA